MITAVQQDYLEIIFRLSSEAEEKSARITDIAKSLGTRLPTVSRSIQKLKTGGYVNHKQHGRVSLSTKGEAMALEMIHLHKDLFQFFTGILGLNKKTAASDICQIEHCLSKETAQRLHEFLEYLNNLSEKQKQIFDNFRTRRYRGQKQFKNLSCQKVAGWRA